MTIYAHATILGGDTVIGANSVVGGNVWLLESVPANSIAYFKADDLVIRPRQKREALDRRYVERLGDLSAPAPTGAAGRTAPARASRAKKGPR